MIKSIRLQNFFGFQDCTVNLEPGANVLIGINGSGKSNFFKAFKLISDGSLRRLNNRINKDWRGINDVLFKGADTDFCQLSFDIIPSIFGKTNGKRTVELNYTIILERHQKNDYLVSEAAKLFHPTDGERLMFSYSNNKGKFVEEENGIYIERPFHSSSDSRELLIASSYFIDDKVPYIAVLRQDIEGILCYSQFDTLEDSQIRKPSPPLIDEQLDEFGDNLVSLLNSLKLNHSDAFKAVKEALKQVNSNFEEIEFVHASNQLEMHLLEKELKSAISPQHISDGTLRFLCLMAICYNPNRGSVVCIDEPELGLHPDMILTLYEAIQHASKTSQVIISTHSAQLLDCFDLEDIRVFEKNEKNETEVLTYSSEKFKDWFDTYTVGQLWRNGHLGGNRW